MLHYIDTPFNKNIELSIARLAEMDLRRGLDSKIIFKDFYKEINHGQAV
jgi:hypothetical protein